MGKNNIISNLFHREVYGRPLKVSYPFGPSEPDRLRMREESILPRCAVEAGHTFMGFTNCGRYLISYTARSCETFGNSWNDFSYVYKLFFWLFVPYKRAKKVTDILLFSNTGVPDHNLLIEIAQWRMNDDKLIIVGQSVFPEESCCPAIYVTITTIPDVQPCPNCKYFVGPAVVVPDGEENMSGYPGMRTCCIRHGATIHLTMDHVSPYPKFNAEIQLRFQESVVLNTGNVFHMFTHKLLEPTSDTKKTDSCIPMPLASNSSTSPLRCDLWFKNVTSSATIKSKTNLHIVETKNSSLEATECIHAQENLLTNFVTTCLTRNSSTPSYTEVPVEVAQQTRLRRFSQSSLDSEISLLSTPSSDLYGSSSSSIKSPSKDATKKQHQTTLVTNIINDEEKPYAKTYDLRSSRNKASAVSPDKSNCTMPPPTERKFFKRDSSSSTVKSSKMLQQQRAAATNLRCSSNSPIEKITNSTQGSEPNSNFSRSESSTVYDVFDIRSEEAVVLERSFSSFRKRRLADKRYEFSECDISTENMTPFNVTRKRKSLRSATSDENSVVGNATMNNPLGSPRSPRTCGDNVNMCYPGGNDSPRGSLLDIIFPRSPRSPRANAITIPSPVMSPSSLSDSISAEVLRPLHSNSSNISANNKTSCIKEESKISCVVEKKELVTTADCKSRPTLSVLFPTCAKVLRSYVQLDDDNLSVITDIEDESSQIYPFPVAIPVDVHGTGYQPLPMISNTKVDRCPAPVIQVLQRTLDIEMLCNEVASMICTASNKQYCSCCDYDPAIVDVSEDKGSISALVAVLVQAIDIACSNSAVDTSTTITVDENFGARKTYEAIFSLVWTPSEEKCQILYCGHLFELECMPSSWHPMRNSVPAYEFCGGSKYLEREPLSNELAVKDWKSVNELTDLYGVVKICKEDSKNNSHYYCPSEHTMIPFLDYLEASSEEEDVPVGFGLVDSDDE